MNERIRQLADQAHEYASGVYDRRIATEGPENVFFYQISNEKFAELIVRECVGVVDDAERGGSNDVWDNAVKFIRRDLQEHFGVEL
jgi:hypothetical protein